MFFYHGDAADILATTQLKSVSTGPRQSVFWPALLAGLSKLSVLRELRGVHLTDESQVDQLSAAPALEVLELCLTTAITSLAGLSHLTCLQSLSVLHEADRYRSRTLFCTLPQLSTLRRLLEFQFRGGDDRGTRDLDGRPQLELPTSQTKPVLGEPVTRAHVLVFLTQNVRHLGVSVIGNWGCSAFWQQLTSLRHLDVSFKGCGACSLAEGRGLSALSQLTHLGMRAVKCRRWDCVCSLIRTTSGPSGRG